MRKVAIVGVEGSGKTVLMAALGQYYVRPDAEGYFLEEQDEDTYMMVQGINQAFKRGEWPASTDADKMVRLNWTLWKRKGTQNESITDISFLDYGGEVYRLAFSRRSTDKNQTGEQYKALQEEYKEQIASLKEHIFSADAILVLVNLRDIVNEETERMSQMLWVTQQIFKQAKEHNEDIGIALAFSQYESYRMIVESKGGLNSVYGEYLPRLAALYPEMKLLTFTAVVNTKTDEKGKEVPPAGKAIESQGMHELRNWLVTCMENLPPPPPPPPPPPSPKKAGDVRVVNLPGGAKMEMVWCPPGTFMMGSPKDEAGRSDDENQHRVTLTKGFWIGKYPVTQAQWKSVISSYSFIKRLLDAPSANISYFKGDNLPVEQVSWEDCQKFCQKVGQGARLPTEAEWEYACRAGMTGKYGGTGNLDEMGWHGNNSGGKTHPVGQKKPNAWGLYDMHGNVWEWCEDKREPGSNYPVGDAMDPICASGWLRVYRGGCWRSDTSDCRCAYRFSNLSGRHSNNLGFRLVCGES